MGCLCGDGHNACVVRLQSWSFKAVIDSTRAERQPEVVIRGRRKESGERIDITMQNEAEIYRKSIRLLLRDFDTVRVLGDAGNIRFYYYF